MLVVPPTIGGWAAAAHRRIEAQGAERLGSVGPRFPRLRRTGLLRRWDMRLWRTRRGERPDSDFCPPPSDHRPQASPSVGPGSPRHQHFGTTSRSRQGNSGPTRAGGRGDEGTSVLRCGNPRRVLLRCICHRGRKLPETTGGWSYDRSVPPSYLLRGPPVHPVPQQHDEVGPHKVVEPLSQIALGLQQFGVENSPASGTAYGVVP